jgi:ribose 1,5-bisphosphokinase
MSVGPGTLVAVVGPSGAGKDTLIDLARRRCAGDSNIVFARRVVTRAASAAEDHDSISSAEFDVGIGRGAFAFWWEAHDLKYGVPAAIDGDIRHGRTVVCNISRAVLPQLRARYANLKVVLVTAPKEVLLARLAGRGRESGRDLAGRAERAAPAVDELAPAIVIENIGTPEDGAARLTAALRGGPG